MLGTGRGAGPGRQGGFEAGGEAESGAGRPSAPKAEKHPFRQPPVHFAAPKERQNAAPNPQQGFAVAQTAGKCLHVPVLNP